VGSTGEEERMSPEIRIESPRKVFGEDAHSALTDPCHFRGRLYVAFRTCPDGHMIFPS
jgi:hypothetical protein